MEDAAASIRDVLAGRRRWAVVHADCLYVISDIPGDAAVITDPPYGIGYRPDGGDGRLARRGAYTAIPGDEAPFDPRPWLDYPAVALWGANHYAGRLPSAPGWLVWDKRDGADSNSFADCEMCWTNRRAPARIYRHQWMGCMRASERRERRYLATQKPVAVMSWTIRELRLADDSLVVDPYCGAGTTGVAALRAGHRFIGIEIDGPTAEIAAARLRTEIMVRSAA